MPRWAHFFAVTAACLLVGELAAQAANDPGLPRQWNMALIDADSAWSVGTGQGVTIAIVDSGVHLTHEDLAARLVAGRNFVTPNSQPQDDNGHGTHVAGIAAAIIDNGAGVVGVAPSARIMPIKVLDRDGEGTYANAAAGIRWAVDNGAHVVNLSLGSTVATLVGSPTVFVQAIEYAWTRGVLCVVAAGNDFVLSSDFSDEDAIVVSATTKNDAAASYSNGVGASKWGLAAPGGAGTGQEADDILSTYWPHTETDALGNKREYGPYAIAAGTSMAAPHVAGAAAVLRSLGLTPTQTVERLRTTAKDLGSKGRDGLYGDGRIDLGKAVAGLAPAGKSGGGNTGGSGTGGSGGGGGAGGPTTTTAGRSGPRQGGSAAPPAGGARSVPAPSTTGPNGAAPNDPATTSARAPGDDSDSDDGVGLDELASPQGSGDERGPAGGDGTTDTSVWPLGALALAALAGAWWAAARLRRARA